MGFFKSLSSVNSYGKINTELIDNYCNNFCEIHYYDEKACYNDTDSFVD